VCVLVVSRGVVCSCVRYYCETQNINIVFIQHMWALLIDVLDAYVNITFALCFFHLVSKVPCAPHVQRETRTSMRCIVYFMT